MAVTIIAGDLLEAKEDIVGHQVNCQAVMGSGVAKLLKTKYPNLYTSYLDYCKDKTPEELLGTLQLVDVQGKLVANIFGQLTYGRSKKVYTDYAALKEALLSLKNYAKEHALTVALPYGIGCGLANGSWEIVGKILEETFDDYEVTLYQIQ
ncbi:macro domain-containing protein [Paenibacillus elgii]|uniref:macro domain-containing protein n=1 Tax=Paenibacillus elgii TaxID=189691 RepID=UPI000FDC10BC|nr:macro domain-containing protein [Paenibacillus elgii]NEN82630.1 macro domain-containing protein [Paenibacillus elgii]